VAAISYDSVEVLKFFAGKAGIQYLLLSDADSALIRKLGILNEKVPQNSMAYGIPNPGSYLVDPSGKVISKYFEDDYTERVTASDILVRQFGDGALGGPHTTVETKHLRLSSSAGTTAVKSGQRIALTIDLEMKPKMHVYAPGAQGYKPIEFRLIPSPAGTAHPLTYPPAKTLFLPAIGEKVPVYDSTLRLVQELTIGRDAALKPLLSPSGEFTIEGELKYQACDDKVCYIPASVPLKWTFVLENHDRERAPQEIRHKAR
jgi:hypothetical protein